MADEPSFSSAARWSFVMASGQYGILLLLNLVLARLLGPEAFGLVAMATIYVVFIQLLLQQGMMPAIIQRRDLDDDHLDTAFWLVMAATAALTVGSVAASGWWADVNRLPELQPVVVVLSLVLPLRGLSTVQEALLRRRLDFKSLALRTGMAMTLGAVAALVLALAGAGEWSLVAQQLITAAVEVTVLWRVSVWRPRVRFVRARARELLGFSGGSFLASLGVFANTRADTVITGLFFGPIAVGWYRLSTRLVTTVVDLAARSLQQAALPELARVQHEPDELRARTVHILRVSALVSLPILGVLAAVSGPLLALLGPDWVAAAPSLEVLCAWAGAASVMLMTGAVLQASGRPYVLAALQWGSAAASIMAFVVVGRALRDDATATQVLGIAWSRALLYGTVLLAVNALVLRAVIGLRVSTQVRCLLPAAVAGLAGAATGVLLRSATAGAPELFRLLATGTGAALVAAGVALLTEPAARDLLHRRDDLDLLDRPALAEAPNR